MLARLYDDGLRGKVNAVEVTLFAVGYPTSIAVITRWIPVVRERRWRWLVAHHVGVSAIIAGWALRREIPAVAVNSGWLVASSAWYALGDRGPERPSERGGGPERPSERGGGR